MNKEKKNTILLILNIIKLSMLKKTLCFDTEKVSHFLVNLYL
jgi:hypothetical protein